LIEVKGPEGFYEVKIYDNMGRLVRVISQGNNAGGFFQWDGKNQNGNVMPPGAYVLYVSVRNGDKVLRKVKPIIIGAK
jgi:flagellar basal-body rod modification protein FlgD